MQLDDEGLNIKLKGERKWKISKVSMMLAQGLKSGIFCLMFMGNDSLIWSFGKKIKMVDAKFCEVSILGKKIKVSSLMIEGKATVQVERDIIIEFSP